MPLLIVLGLLAGYGSYRFVNFCKTEAKPKSNNQLENMEEHLKTIQSLPNQNARQKYLKDIVK